MVPHTRGLKIPVDVPTLKEKLKKLHLHWMLTTNHPTGGWTDKKKRCGRLCKKMSRKANGVKCKPGRIQFLHIWWWNTHQIISSAQMILVYFKILPLREPTHSEENIAKAWKKTRKESPFLCVLTWLVPVLVGKFKQPHCFKNTKSLPRTYLHNKAVWMIREISINFWSISIEEWHLRTETHSSSSINVSHSKTLLRYLKNVQVSSFLQILLQCCSLSTRVLSES